MFSNYIKKLKSHGDALLSKFFPSVRGAVLLIIIPAVFIVIIYFFSIFTEVVPGKKKRTNLEYEIRLADIKKDLPVNGVVNYVSDSNAKNDLIHAEYVLIPVRVVAGLNPRHDHLVYQSFNEAEKTEIKGYTLKKNYGNGVMLFYRDK